MGKSLDEIGISFGTDKSSLEHDYLKYYEKLFPDRNSVKNILEIGLLRGGKWKQNNKSSYPSLSVWKEWFPNAVIFGFDKKDIKANEERVIIYQGNQSKRRDLKKLRSILPELDLIIDDGSHVHFDQQLTFLLLSRKLKSGGYYVIEDLFSKASNGGVYTTLEILKTPKTIWTNYFFAGYEIEIKDSKRKKENIAFLRKK